MEAIFLRNQLVNLGLFMFGTLSQRFLVFLSIPLAFKTCPLKMEWFLFNNRKPIVPTTYYLMGSLNGLRGGRPFSR